MDHIWTWIMNFIGVNNSYNDFSTHMYNFWSGFGGNISILALVGTVLGVYRHHIKYSRLIDLARKMTPMHEIHDTTDKTDKHS